MGVLPYAAIGTGRPVVVLAGLSPTAGEVGDNAFRTIVRPVRNLAGTRRLIAFNRWKGMPAGITMRELAARHDEAIRDGLSIPVDVVGVSTGGTIAQQLAADHPDTVRRLALVSTACRLGPAGRDLQARVATLLRAGSTRQAVGLVAGALAPTGLRSIARAFGWSFAPLMLAGSSPSDLIATIDAEDAFDLAECPPIRALSVIVAGARDRFYGPDLFHETAALIPGSRLALFPRRGHVGVVGDRRASATLVGFLGG